MANEKRITPVSVKTNRGSQISVKTNRGSQTPTYTPPTMPKVQPPKTTNK